MIEVTVDIVALNKLLAQIESGVQIGTRKAVNDVANIIQGEVITAIKEVNAIASTDLMNSVGSNTAQNRLSTGQFASGFSTSVGSNLPYASDIEEGMPAGRPVSSEEILTWMINKGLEPSLIAAGHIAKKLRERGYEGRHVFAKGLERSEGRVQGIAEQDIQESLSKI